MSRTNLQFPKFNFLPIRIYVRSTSARRNVNDDKDLVNLRDRDENGCLKMNRWSSFQLIAKMLAKLSVSLHSHNLVRVVSDTEDQEATF